MEAPDPAADVRLSARRNSAAHFTATFRYYGYLALLDSWRFLRVRRNLFHPDFGLGPRATVARIHPRQGIAGPGVVADGYPY